VSRGGGKLHIGCHQNECVPKKKEGKAQLRREPRCDGGEKQRNDAPMIENRKRKGRAYGEDKARLKKRNNNKGKKRIKERRGHLHQKEK